VFCILLSLLRCDFAIAAAAGGGDPGDMWVPSGDSQLDALMRIKAALDTHDLLTGWRPENGRSSGYCSWDFVTCGADGKTVQASVGA